MITREQVRTVIDSSVCDSEGNKIGKAKHVFLDDATGRPEWVSVKTGLFGTNESFVPIHDAAMVDDCLKVPYAKDTVKDAPNVDVDAGGHLSETEERRLYKHYGLDGDGAWPQGDQAGQGGWAAATAGGTAAAGTAAMGTGTAPMGIADNDAAAMGAAADHGLNGDNAMTRSEERMHVAVERRETGRARLRKYVVTEEQEQTVPVRHEEVRIEREQITDANRDAALTGPDISEAEYEVTLHEERPVTQIETVPVERVRLDTSEVTEEQTVRGTIRKEQIEAETEMDADR